MRHRGIFVFKGRESVSFRPLRIKVWPVASFDRTDLNGDSDRLADCYYLRMNTYWFFCNVDIDLQNCNEHRSFDWKQVIIFKMISRFAELSFMSRIFCCYFPVQLH